MAHTHTYNNYSTSWHISNVISRSVLAGTPSVCPSGHATCGFSGEIITITNPGASGPPVNTGLAEDILGHTHTISVIEWSGGMVNNLAGAGGPANTCGNSSNFFNISGSFPKTATLVEVQTSEAIVLENGCHYHTFTALAAYATTGASFCTELTTCNLGHASCTGINGSFSLVSGTPAYEEHNTSTDCTALAPWVETNNPTNIHSRSATLNGTNHGCTEVYFEYEYWSISGASMGSYSTSHQTNIESTYSANITMKHGWYTCCFKAVGTVGENTYYGETICFYWYDIEDDMIPSDHLIEINKFIEHVHPVGEDYTPGITVGNAVDHGTRVVMDIEYYHTHGAGYPGKVYMSAFIGNWPPHSLSEHS